jgi:chromosome segregation ATPase
MPSPDRYRNTLWIVTAAWIGATAILTWLSYGDAARRIIASSYPRLGWLAPSPAPITRSATDMTSLAAEAAPPPVQQRLNAMSLDLEAVRRSVDRLLIAQEQITRDVNQLMAGQEQITRDAAQLMAGQEQITRDAAQLSARQEQMTSEITKLQAIEQQSLQKNSERAPRPAPALARIPIPRSSLTPMIR